MIFVKAEKEHEGIEDMPPAEGGDFLHILHGGSEEALLGNLRKPPHTTISSLTCFTLLSVNIAVLPGFFLFLLYHYYTTFLFLWQ